MKTSYIRRKRAFTLTELLIVVIVIGVLSAVTLPKFNRVIENRKVTEAEEMMSAVRTEQERRCSLDQNYTTNFDSLSDVIASNNTKNYTYSLQSQGISAKSNSGDYTLKILSYEDGSYCCTGAGCKKLNKNYPDCAGLSFPTSNCAGTEGAITPPGTEPTPGEPEEPECSDGAVQGSQSCNGCGTQTTQKCVGGKWVNSLGSCSKTAEECAPAPECSGTRPADAIKQCDCGTVKASYKCDASTNYEWVQGAFPECPAKPADITETCSDGKTVRTKAYSCVNNVWTAGNWDKECPAACPDGKELWNGECVCPRAVDEECHSQGGTLDENCVCQKPCPEGKEFINGECVCPRAVDEECNSQGGTLDENCVCQKDCVDLSSCPNRKCDANAEEDCNRAGGTMDCSCSCIAAEPCTPFTPPACDNADSKRTACQNSGGTWSDSSCFCNCPDTLVSSNGVCKKMGLVWSSQTDCDFHLPGGGTRCSDFTCNRSTMGRSCWKLSAGTGGGCDPNLGCTTYCKENYTCQVVE